MPYLLMIGNIVLNIRSANMYTQLNLFQDPLRSRLQFGVVIDRDLAENKLNLTLNGEAVLFRLKHPNSLLVGLFSPCNGVNLVMTLSEGIES